MLRSFSNTLPIYLFVSVSDTTDVPFGVGCNSPVVCLQHRDAVLLGSSATETEPSQIQPGGSTGSSGCEVRGGGVGEGGRSSPPLDANHPIALAPTSTPASAPPSASASASKTPVRMQRWQRRARAMLKARAASAAKEPGNVYVLESDPTRQYWSYAAFHNNNRSNDKTEEAAGPMFITLNLIHINPSRIYIYKHTIQLPSITHDTNPHLLLLISQLQFGSV